VGILVYGYATGDIFEPSWERATYESVAFRFIGQRHPGPRHNRDVPAKIPQAENSKGCRSGLLLARGEMGMLKLGTLGARRHEDPR